jgi:23S rRNA (cytosine1962-C5)-methyltransferase
VPTVRLKPKHVQPLWAGHPWVFAQAIASIEGAPTAGDEVRVVDPEGKLLGRGYYSPKSAIPVRILDRREGEPLEGAALAKKIETAAKWRREILDLPNASCTGYRLVNGEGDGLAGLIVDVFGDAAVVQLLTAGMKRREADVIAHVQRVSRAKTVMLTRVDAMATEEFAHDAAIVRGPSIDALSFVDRGFRMEIPMEVGQKTGFYFDQRDNRARVEALSKGRRVLDAFSFVGAFSLGAARGGATEIVALDRSATAIAAGASIAAENGVGDKIRFMRGDTKEALPAMRARGERFDLVVCDPPKLATTVKDLERARRAYRRVNANSLALVEPGGLLMTCSCSAAMSVEDLARTVALAARDVAREVQWLETHEQAADHPMLPAFEHGRYLSALLFRVDR